MDDKKIILVHGGQPEFVGKWTIEEVLAMADSLKKWVFNLSLYGEPEEIDEPDDGGPPPPLD